MPEGVYNKKVTDYKKPLIPKSTAYGGVGFRNGDFETLAIIVSSRDGVHRWWIEPAGLRISIAPLL
jgi:hypothetical protein